MADIRLVRPEAGTNQAVACEPEARFVFDFPTDAATLSRNGDNLVMTFEDGATLTLTDFYKAYSSKNMPSFEVDGAQVAGADFFAAMNEPDLMPAAGPGGRAAAAGVGGGRYHEYANMALYDGLDRLGGLDVGWPDGGYEPEIDGAAGRRGDEEGGYLLTGTPDGIPSITPTVPDRPGWDPDTPSIPNPKDPNTPSNPDNPGSGPTGGPADPSTGRDVLSVSERGLEDGTDHNAPTKATGSMHVESPDGVKDLTVGGTSVFNDEEGFLGPLGENGERGPVDVETDEGVLHVTDVKKNEDGSYTVEYEYELKSPSDEHSGEGHDKFGHDITVTVTDPDGDTASSTITVVVEDDAPVANDDDAGTVTEGGDSGLSGNVLTGMPGHSSDDTRLAKDQFGADGPQGGEPTVHWNIPEGWVHVEGTDTYHTPYGDITLNDDGSYAFTLDPKSSALQELKEGKADLKVGYSITDADGDTDSATLTLHVQGENHDVTIATDPDPDPDGGDGVIANGVSHVTVYESGLAKGTEEGNKPTTAENSFTVTAEDGLQDLTINDQSVWSDGRFTEKTITDEYGNTLHITNVKDNGNGTYTVTYDYTLNKATDQHSEQGKDQLDSSFTVKATDLDGDVSEGSITATVFDDAPKAEDDNAGPVTEGSSVPLTGNVTDNDAYGADQAGKFDDGATVHWNIPEGWAQVDGTNTYHTPYGDITLYNDGRYDFMVNKDAGLEPNKTAELLVSYTITDADGDESTADLTITVTGDNNIPEITPQEPDPDGDNNKPSGTPGKIVVDEGTQPESTTENNKVDTGHESHGQRGTGSFDVQLNGEGGTITVGGASGYTITVDKDGKVLDVVDHTGGTGLHVQGVDVTLGVKTGDKLTQGTDGWEIGYQYSLNGAQTHDAAHDQTLSGSIDITVTDDSGDTRTGSLTVEVHDDAAKAVNDNVSIVEKETVHGNVLAGTATVTGTDGKTTTDVDTDGTASGDRFGADGAGTFGEGENAPRVQWNVKGDEKPNGDIIVTTDYGTATLHPDGTYDFTSVDNNTLTPGHSAELTFGYTITDADGDTSDAELTITVKGNDTPDISTDPENPSTPPDGTLGVMADKVTVDEAAWAQAEDMGQGSDHTEHGYKGQGGFDVDLHGEGGTITVGGGVEKGGCTITVGEDGTISVTEGAGLTVNGVRVSNFEAEFKDGKLHVSYQYELTDNVQHNNPAEVGAKDSTSGNIEIHVTDSVNGDTADGYISVEVHDDGPKLTVQPGSLTQGNGVEIDDAGQVTLKGHIEFSFGADADEGAKVYVKGSGQGDQFVEGEYDSETGTYTFRLSEGTLTLDPGAGTFECELSRHQGSTEQDYTFTFKVEDSDGDSKEDTVTAKVPRLDSNVDVSYEDVTNDGKGDSVAREAGVRGHGDPDNPNWQVWYDNESSENDLHGSITLKGENEAPENITSLNITGVTTHYSDTDVAHENQSYENSSPSDNLPSLRGEGGQSGITLYVVKDEHGQFTVTDEPPADNEYYGTLTLTKNAEKGSVEWNFHLNTDNPDLLNSLNEGEQIDVQLQFSVNDGSAKQKGTLEFSIKGTDDKPQVQADFSVNPGVAAGLTSAHVEDAGVTDVWGWSGTFGLPAGKGGYAGHNQEFVGVPGYGIQFKVGGESCEFFRESYHNGWRSADFVLKDGSIFHVEVIEESPDGWKFSYSITPGKGRPGPEDGGQCPDIEVELKYQWNDNTWLPVGKVTSPGGPNEHGLTVYSSDIPFNAAGRHVPSAEEGRLEDYDPTVDRSQQLESETHGNKENTPWEGIPVVRLGIKATDPDADGGSGQDNLFTVDETTGLNDGFQHNAKVGFQGWDKNLYTWGSPEEFKAVWDDCEQHGWKIGYKPQHVEEGQFNGMPPGDYLVHHADYGDFYIDQWGNIFYVLNTGDGSAADKLPEGAYVNDVREFVVQDEHGAWSSNYFGVTVKGANEAPEITDVTYKEGTPLDAEGHPEVRALGDDITKESLNQATLTGTVAAKDRDVTGLNEQGKDVTEKVEYFLVDENGNLVESVQTEHGRVTINPETGEFTYTLDSTDDSVTHLKQYNEDAAYHGDGVDSLTDEFFVGARDPHGAVDIKKQEVTIKGTNSTPHIESVTDDGSDDGLSFQLKEAGVTVSKENNPESDYMAGDNGRSVLKGSVKADDINDAGVAAGQSTNDLTYSFTVDGGTAGEAGDAPHPAPEGFTHYVVTDYGVLWYNEKGDYQYELDPDKTNSLNEGEIVAQKVTVTVTDDAGAQDEREFTVQIVGTNDAPQFVGDDGKTPLADGQSVELTGENGQYSAHLQAVDPDKDGEGNVDYTFKGELQDGQEGSPNPGINQSQSFATELGTFSIADEHEGTVTFTANPTSGLMEAARNHLRTFFKQEKPGELNEDGQKALESGFIEQVHEGGGLNFTEEGWQEWLKGIKDNSELKEWLEKNNAYITDEGDLVVHADVYAVDQYGAADKVDVTVELTPPSVPGDGPDLDMPDTLKYGKLNVRESGKVNDPEIAEHGQRDSSGVTLEFTEPKEPQDKNLYGFTFVPKNGDGEKGEDIPLTGSRQSIETPYGTLTINPDTGEVEFVLDNSSADVQKLKDTDKFEDAIKEALEKYFDDYSIVVYEKSNPSNNREFPLDGSGKGEEGKAGTLEGPELNIYGAETPPELTVDPVLDIDLAADGNDGKSAKGKATTRDLDSEGERGTLTYSVKGNGGDLQEDTDGNGWKTYTNEYGTFHLNEQTGEYSFTADGEAAKELPVGGSWTGQFTITVTDDSGQSDSQEVTVQVHGANDDPEISQDNLTVTVEDTDNAPGKVLDGKLEATDPDKGDTNLTWSVADENGNPAGSSVQTEHGTFTVNPDGSYTFESNGKAKDKVQDKVTVVVDDGHGGRTTQELTFDIQGVDDKVVFEGEGGTVTLSQLGAGVTTTTGQLAVHDLDDPDVTLQGTVSFDSYEWELKDGDWVKKEGTAQQTVTWKDGDGSIVVHGQYGDLTVYEDGHYTYSVKPGVSDKLWRDKHNLKDTFDVHIEGAEQPDQKLEFTIDYDQNNKPEIHAESQNSTQGSFTLSDADNNDTLWYTPEAKFDGMDVRVEQTKTDATDGWSEYWALAESGSSSWTLYGVDAETHEEVVLGELTITKSGGNGKGYTYDFKQAEDWDQAGNLEVDLRVYDGHNAVKGDLFTAELSDQAKAEDDTISLTGQEDAQASLFSVDALSDEDGEGVFSDTDEALSAEAGDVRAGAYDNVMDSLSPASWEDPQDQAAGQSAPDKSLSNGDQDAVFGTPDDDLIVYDATDYAVFGGDGIDVLLSKNSQDTLDDLLGTPLGGQDRPHVENVELFLKGTGTDAEGNTFSVEDLTSLSDLAEKAGITVDNASGTVTLDERWEKTDDGTYASKDGLTLETTLADVTPKSTDAAATQAANEILLTQQG